MTAKVEVENIKFDVFKLSVAALLIVTAMGAFYMFPEQSLFYRVLGLLAVTGVSVAIALQTDKGRSVWMFFKDARMEVRKVVWPTRKEAMQTTMIVFLMVVLVAIFLWLLDMLLGWAVKYLTG